MLICTVVHCISCVHVHHVLCVHMHFTCTGTCTCTQSRLHVFYIQYIEAECLEKEMELKDPVGYHKAWSCVCGAQ